MNVQLSNPDILPCVCASSPFDDKYYSHKITGELRIINNSRLTNMLCPKYRKYTLVDLEKVKNYILSELGNYVENYYSKYGIRKSMFTKRANNKEKINNRISILSNALHKHNTNIQFFGILVFKLIIRKKLTIGLVF